MTFDESARGTSIRTQVSSDELWERLKAFLQGVLPVAEEAGVRMAAHPDDPPVPRLRDTPRLVYQADLYQKLIDLVPSNSNQLEFCLGTLAEMPGCDVLKATRHYAQQGKIAYVHFRNVRGHAPDYQEVFIDEGDIELPAVIRVLHQSRFDGVLIPDHAPQMACRAPWHAGMAYSMGYLKALIEQCR